MIYLFDENEKLIRIVSRKSIKTAEQKFSLADRYVSDRLEIEMKAMSDTELEKVEYMAIQSIDNRHKFHFFYVLQKETEGFITSLTGVQSGIEELRKTPVYEKRPRAMQARPVIEDLLKNTNWIPRYIAPTKFKNTMFYYTSVFESLKKACEVWDLEMQFFVEMNGNQIGARYIDFKKKIGKAVGKRVVYGHNALTIIKEVERTELYTALIGRGKGEEVSSAEENESGKAGYGRKINFEEIVWRKSEGKPVDKPAGQRYVEIPEMTKRYGIRQADGTMKPKIGFIEFGEEEDRELLLEQTYEALVTASRPAVTFKTTTAYLKNVEIGDTVRVIRHDRNLYYETRVFEITFNRLNNTSADIKLGDKVSGGSTGSIIQSAVDKAIEDWVVEDFNKFVEKLPDFLPSADGFNQNWYSEEDPTVTHPKKVMIGDIWYKPDPEHEGHKIMLRWTGEMWEEILRTYNAERLKEQIEAEMAEVNGKMKGLDVELKTKVAELLAKAGVAESAADEAKRLAEKAGIDLIKERERSNLAIQGALSEARRLDQEDRKTTEAAILAARNKANDEAKKLVDIAKQALEADLLSANSLVLETKRTLESQMSGVSVELIKTNDGIKSLAKKTDVDRVNQRLTTAETTIAHQENQLALKANQQAVDGLAGRVRSAESSITLHGDQLALKANKSDVDTLSGKVSKAEASLQVQGGQIAAKANKTDVDNMGRRIASAEASLTAQAGEIAQRVKKSDFDRETGRLNTVEASVRNLGDRVTTEISRTEAKIPNSIGLRNLILKSADFGNPYKQNGSRTTVTAQDGYWQIRSEGYTSNAWGGTAFNLSVDTLRAEEDYSFYTQVYIDSTDRAAQIDSGFTISFKDHVFNKTVFSYPLPTNVKNRWIDVAFSFRPTSDLEIKENGYELFIFLTKNGLVRVKPPILVKGKLIPTSHVPAPEDTIQEIQSVKTTITQNAEGTRQLSTKLAQAEGKSSRQETRINQLIGDVSSKVSQTDYDNLKRTVEGHTTDVRQTKEAIALKADKTLVTTVQTAATEAKNLANSANSKADSATAKANQADSKATSANTKADQASTKADSAVSTANQANQKATVADDKATNAATKAEDAVKKSAEAMTKSVNALTKAGLVDEKAGEALAKAIQNSQSISRAQAELQVANESIKTKVAKVDFDLANRKLATAETQINTIAGQISTKLSRTEVVQTIESKGYQTADQVDSKINSKGYQTAGQVDSLVQSKGYQTANQVEAAITSKGYVTTSTFSNTIQQTERGMTARIAQVETRIPSSFSHRNIMRGTSDSWGPYRDITIKENWLFDLGQVPLGDQTGIYPDTKVNLFVYVSADNIVLDESATNKRMFLQGRIRDSSGNWTWANWSRNHPFFNKWSRNLNAGNNYALIKVSGLVTREMYQNSKGFELQIRIDGAKSGKFRVRALMVTTGDIAPDYWSPAPEDFATTIALHEVRDTVDGHTRTLTAQGRSISQVTQTAEGIVSRVANTESSLTRLDGRANFVESALNSTKTEVSQLAGSWAVRNLTSSGTVLNQLNLNRDGSVKIDGKLVQITGQTYIQDGVISSAKIGNLDAGKITTGTLNAARINLINLDASKITTGSLDARFIRGGVLSSLNGATMFDLQNGELNFMTNNPAIRRVVAGLPNQFVRFGTGFESSDGTFSNLNKRRTINSNVSSASFGVNRSGWEVTNTGSFTGINVFASGPAQGDNVVDRIGIHSDILVVSHNTIEGQRGWIFENWVPDVNQKRLYTMRPMHNDHVNYKAYIGTSEYPIDDLFALEITFRGHRLAAILKDIANRIGHSGWANNMG